MLAKHPGIKDQMETKGYTCTFNNKKRNYKFINGDLKIEEEIRQPKYKKNSSNEYEEDGSFIVGEGSSVQKADSIIEQDQPIVKKITNDDWMEMLNDNAQPDITEDVRGDAEEQIEAEHCEDEEFYKILEEVKKQEKTEATEEVEEPIEGFENIEEIQEETEEAEREPELKLDTKTKVEFEPWSMISIEELRGNEILSKQPKEMYFNTDDTEEAVHREAEEEEEAWKYYDGDENDDFDPYNTHPEWNDYNYI